MSNNLCRIWSELASHPDDANAIAEARAHLTQLLEHVDDCDECRVISESMRDETREAVFAVLSQGGIAIAKEELAILKTMDQVLSDDRKAIDAGVEFLLAGLPADLGTPDQIAAGAPLTPLDIFLGIDAVNMLVRSHAARSGTRSVQLSKDGLRVDGKLVSKRDAIVGEIGRHAKLTAPVANRLWTWQLGVAELCPTLYRGLEVSKVVRGQLQLRLQKSASSTDLLKRWRIQPKEVVSEGDVREILGELAGTLAVWKQWREPSSLRKFGYAPQAVADVAKLRKLLDQIDRDNKELEKVIEPLNVEPITYGDDPLTHLKKGKNVDLARVFMIAEVRKRYCFNVIAGVTIRRAGGINIKPLQETTAKIGAKAERYIEELSRLTTA
jgi:hypothetical protein